MSHPAQPGRADVIKCPFKAVFMITGGGTGFIDALLSPGGASSFCLEAIVPYSYTSLTNWLAGTPDKAVSCETAIQMATQALSRASILAPAEPKSLLLGVGVTASLACENQRIGRENHAHMCIACYINETQVITISHHIDCASFGQRHQQEMELEYWIMIQLARFIVTQHERLSNATYP